MTLVFVLPFVVKALIPVRAAFTLVGFFQVLAGFVQRALRGGAGLYGLAVFVDGALALASGIKDLAQHNVAPDLGPAGIAIAIERFTEFIGSRLVVALQEENVGNAVMRQRTALVYVQRLV